MIQASPTVVFQTLRDEAVLYDLETETFFALNETSTRMWHLLSEGMDQAGVCDVVCAEYEVDEDQVRADLEAFVGQLVTRGLAHESVS